MRQKGGPEQPGALGQLHRAAWHELKGRPVGKMGGASNVTVFIGFIRFLENGSIFHHFPALDGFHWFQFRISCVSRWVEEHISRSSRCEVNGCKYAVDDLGLLGNQLYSLKSGFACILKQANLAFWMYCNMAPPAKKKETRSGCGRYDISSISSQTHPIELEYHLVTSQLVFFIEALFFIQANHRLLLATGSTTKCKTLLVEKQVKNKHSNSNPKYHKFQLVSSSFNHI